MIAIVDYDAGNIKSVEKALQYIGEDPVVTRDTEKITQADKIIVPGVGAFEGAMGKMNHYHLVEVLQEMAMRGTPMLGICLGLQLFFERSDESQHNVPGLGLLPGEIVKFPMAEGYKIPHMGWNSIHIRKTHMYILCILIIYGQNGRKMWLLLQNTLLMYMQPQNMTIYLQHSSIQRKVEKWDCRY